MIEFNEHKPIYLQISDTVCEKILNEEYREEERIPSVRELGASLGVNPNTIARTYEYLKSIGVIYDKRGVGFFISTGAKRDVISVYRREFIEKELPSIAKKIQLLDIDFDELKQILSNTKTI